MNLFRSRTSADAPVDGDFARGQAQGLRDAHAADRAVLNERNTSVRQAYDRGRRDERARRPRRHGAPFLTLIVLMAAAVGAGADLSGRQPRLVQPRRPGRRPEDLERRAARLAGHAQRRQQGGRCARERRPDHQAEGRRLARTSRRPGRSAWAERSPAAAGARRPRPRPFGARSMPQNSDTNAGKGDKQPPGEGQVQGEGDYVAGRRFQDAERSFAEKGPVEQKAREAAKALDGPEGEELERARHRERRRQDPLETPQRPSTRPAPTPTPTRTSTRVSTRRFRPATRSRSHPAPTRAR